MIMKLYKLVYFFSFCPYWSLGAIWRDITRKKHILLWKTKHYSLSIKGEL
jgi:hypothetical protein